jgi:hypothetical protein
LRQRVGACPKPQPRALLVITNWINSGATRIFFGYDASALTASQLAQIQFANPGGFAPGPYPAQLLSTGELVPAPRPTLQMTRTGSALVFTWSGNYQLLQPLTSRARIRRCPVPQARGRTTS